jgi:hypothetical protein
MARMTIDTAPEWVRALSPESIKFYLDMFNVHERPENADIDEPPTVDQIRRLKELEKKTKEHEVKINKHESALKRGLTNVLKLLE